MNRDKQTATHHADRLLMTPGKAVIVGGFEKPAKAVLRTGTVGCYGNAGIKRAVADVEFFEPNISSVILGGRFLEPREYA
jgi:hypothetical protein